MRFTSRKLLWIALAAAAVAGVVVLISKSPPTTSREAPAVVAAEGAHEAGKDLPAAVAQQNERRAAIERRSEQTTNVEATSTDEGAKLRELEERAYEAARTAPLDAMRIAVAMPDSPARSQLVTHVIAQWAEQDPTQAVTWAMQIVDENLRDQVISSALIAWADRDPLPALTMALGGLAEGSVRDRSVAAVIQRWHQRSPDAAQAWVGALTRGQQREQLEHAINELKPADQKPDG